MQIEADNLGMRCSQDRFRPCALHIRVQGGRVSATGDRHCRRGMPENIHVEWSWDGRTLTVRNCRLGFHPLFVRICPDGISIAETATGVFQAGEAPELDLAALSVFIHLGFFVGDDTPFLGVKQLPPGTILTWTGTGTVGTDTAPRLDSEPTTVTRESAIRIYAEMLNAAVGHLTRDTDHILVPLSGGRDSRHIALALRTTSPKNLVYFTVRHLPWRPDEDVRVAKALVAALGGRHIVVAQPAWYVDNITDCFAELGFCSDEHSWLYPLRQVLKRHEGIVLDGIGGDVLSAALFQEAELHDLCVRGSMEAAAERVIRRFSASFGGTLDMFAKDAGLPFSRTYALERIMMELTRFRESANPARDFFFWNRTRREIALAPFGLLRGMDVRAPFLDRELVPFLLSLPYSIVSDGRFHTDTIAYAFPAFSRLPYENKHASRDMGFLGSSWLAVQVLAALTRSGAAGKLDLRCVSRRSGRVLTGRSWWSWNGLLYLSTLLGWLGKAARV